MATVLAAVPTTDRGVGITGRVATVRMATTARGVPAVTPPQRHATEPEEGQRGAEQDQPEDSERHP